MFKIYQTIFALLAGQSLIAAPKPNVIIIYADDLGYGDVSCNGAKRVKTPNVDRLAEQGVRFTNAHATSATSTPSRYSLLTGDYAWRRKDTGIAPGDAPLLIPTQKLSLPAMMQKAGYRTAVVGKWHLGLGIQNQQDWNGRIAPGPAEIGFDYSFIMAATADRVPCVFLENQKVVGLDPADPISVSFKTPFPGEPLGKDHPELLTAMKPSHGHDQAIVNGISRIGYAKGGKAALWNDQEIGDRITANAISFIEKNQATPFFLYFGTNDIHVPRVPHPRFVGKTGMGPRGDAILEFDWSVGQLMDALTKNNLLANTLIILSSDNGPVVDDGYADRAEELLGNHTPGGPFRGGKYSNFEAGTRVPCIVSWPSRVSKGKVSPALLSQIDLFASLAALTGQKLPDNAAGDSFDQLNAWLGKDLIGREYVVEHSLYNTLSLCKGEYKYIEPSNARAYDAATKTELGNSKEPQLYQISKELGEKNNLAVSNPQKVKELSDLLLKVKSESRTRK